MLIFVDEEFTIVFDDGGGHEDKQITGCIHFRAPPKQSAEDRNVTQHRNRLDDGGPFPFKNATHDDGFAGLYNHARGELLGAILWQVNVKGAGGVAASALKIREC